VTADQKRREVGAATGDTAAPRGFLAQGLNFTRRFIVARLSRGDTTPIAELPAGEGGVLKLNGEKTAAWRDEQGELHALSPICTHLGCEVEWNGGERTWDCPCHGSRFDVEGQVLRGPAKRELERKDLDPT
jgi:Rieske Fe-S protein